MALCWTMDKLGPIARSVEDCALVLEAIHGPDGKDTSAYPADFSWDPNLDWKQLRIGYLKSEFDPPSPLKLKDAAANETADEKKKREEQNAAAQAARARRDYDRRFDLAALDKLRAMGVNLIPVELPKLPWDAMVPLLTAEAAAAFDDLTMTGRDSLLTEQGAEDWPNAFRIGRLYPAVEYIQANRARTLGIRQMSALFEKVDIVVTPSTDTQLIATNLTGHPALILPNGLRGDDAPAPRLSTTATTTTLGVPARRSRSRSSPGTTRTPNWPPLPVLIRRVRAFINCIRSWIIESCVSHVRERFIDAANGVRVWRPALQPAGRLLR